MWPLRSASISGIGRPLISLLTVQMSRRPSRDDTGFVAGAAGLMMAGFGVSYARRRKNRPELARAWR